MRECGTLPRKRHYDSGSDEEWISKKPKMKQLEDDPELQAMLLVNKRRFRVMFWPSDDVTADLALSVENVPLT